MKIMGNLKSERLAFSIFFNSQNEINKKKQNQIINNINNFVFFLKII